MRSLHALVTVLALVACDKADTPAPAATAPPNDTSAAPVASEPKAPRSKPTETPTAAALGTLPEGVGIAPGQPAPDFTAKDAKGAEQRLSTLWKGGPVLLVFYRGGWCPFCNFQVRALVNAKEEFARRKVTPVFVSVDSVAEAAKTHASYEIPFPVLSDPELAGHEAFRVIERIDAATVEKYKTMGIDLEKSSGKNHHTIAVPALFLIDAEGKVRWAHADRDYKTRPATAQLLAAIDTALAPKE